ncbi:unnamed protein product [Ilex paraguariensis]|uniref:Cytochrome b561 and DOMON domain-containing protein n=1 Tax=Ilex paraguariensis TaxID=185542 RepID=A0ABC8UML0_9AQUA
MGATSRLALVSCVLISLFLSSSAQSCTNYAFASNKVFSTCNDLPYLNSFLHWTYDPSSETVQIAFRHTRVTSSKWVAWAINPNSTSMVGSQALVAFQKSDGTMRYYTSPVTSYGTQLAEGDLSFPVSDLLATFSNNEITIFATLNLQKINSTTVNQVWQDGPVSGDTPGAHDQSGDNILSMGTINLLSGESGTTVGGGGGNTKIKKRNIHGVLNAISWGIMMPVGALFARYLKVFKSADPAWFYLHVTCQTSAYIIGVAGWATGLKLGSESPGIQHTTHRNIGILLFLLGTLQIHGVLNAISWGIMMPVGALFARYLKVFKSADPAWFYLHVTCQTSAYIIGVAGWATGLKLGSESPGIQHTTHRNIGILLFLLGTLQVFALLLRPNKNHKYRFYWNIYHHSVGYMVILLSIVNIFKGFDILKPEHQWQRAYTAIIVILAIIAVLLEAYTWFVVVKRKKAASAEKMPQGTNETNGHNGYGARTQERV